MAVLTVYPDPDAETSSVDGYVARWSVDESWAAITSGAGNQVDDTASSFNVNITAGSVDGLFATLRRIIVLFDTSTIGVGATVTAAVLSVYGFSKADAAGWLPNIDVYTSTPASNTALEIADYGQIQATSQTGTPITYAGYSTSGYNDFTFNATGRGNVAVSGISKFALRNANYDVAGSAPVFSSAYQASNFLAYAAEQATTTNDPKLVVTYTLPGLAGVKTVNGLVIASVKTINGLAIASVKTWNGLT